MAIDTRDKRASVFGSFYAVLPEPDGVIDAGDRAEVAWVYDFFSGPVIPNADSDVFDPVAFALHGIISYKGTHNPITSGSLSTVTFVSGTPSQVRTGRDTSLIVPVTYNPTALLSATCKVELSPDGVTYSTLVTKTVPAVASLAGIVDEVELRVPAAWYVKLTVSSATLGAGTYW